MRRRDFITYVGGMAVVWPALGSAQQAKSTPRIGFLGTATPSGYEEQLKGFRRALRDLGYEEGKNIQLELRWANGNYDRLAELANELIRQDVDVLVTHGTPGAATLKKATGSIPIVVAVVGDAVNSGLVKSLARPGGNITGLSFLAPELSAKRLEFLKDVMPSLASLATIFNVNSPVAQMDLDKLGITAKALGVELRPFGIRGPDQFDQVFSAITEARIQAVSVIHDAVLTANIKPLAQLALKYRLPSIGEGPFVRAGGMIGYGPDFADLFRRSAWYVDRILKGAHPRDLPIEQPTKFETLFNLKTASAIGIEIPPAVIAQADEVIE
jgi:putative tryptophan/tyrosine transport system substrate-binding protein